MTGLSTFLGKEIREIVRTWRLWVVPGLLVLFAVTGPPMARYTRELLASVMGEQAKALPMPDPTYVDAYQQWTKNLGQLVLFAVIVTLGSVVSGELRSGTATLMLTKPVSRAAFITAKVVAHLGHLVAATLLGAAVTWGVTRAFFADAPLAPLLAATLGWLVLAGLVVTVVVLGSCVTPSGAAAAGVGLAAYLVLAVGSVWGPAARWTPAGLVPAPDHLARGEDLAWWWPVGSGLLAAALAWALAVWALRRREL